jgi:hypothetical protein
MTALFIIRWRGTNYGAFTWRDAESAIRNFYPGGEIRPA